MIGPSRWTAPARPGGHRRHGEVGYVHRLHPPLACGGLILDSIPASVGHADRAMTERSLTAKRRLTTPGNQARLRAAMPGLLRWADDLVPLTPKRAN